MATVLPPNQLLAAAPEMTRTSDAKRLRPARAQPWIDAYAAFGVLKPADACPSATSDGTLSSLTRNPLCKDSSTRKKPTRGLEPRTPSLRGKDE